jgi:hypothetical protein
MRTIATTCGVALAIVLTWSRAAVAQTGGGDEGRAQMEEARRLMEQGQELYLSGEFARAAVTFQQAYETSPFGAFLFNAAVAYERNEEWARAAEFFARYLERSPNAPDAATVAARIETLRTRAQGGGTGTTEITTTTTTTGTGTGTETGTGTGTGTETGTATETGTGTVAAPRHGRGNSRDMKSLLAIRTNPDGAQVTVTRGGDVIASGPTPFAHDLEAGARIHVKVEHPDYRTLEHDFEITPGTVYMLVAELSQGAFVGFLRVVSSVPGASVYVDDHAEGAVGQTPWSNVMPIGSHQVWVERPGYEPVERTVDVGIGDTAEVEVELERVSHGRIRVNANVRGATIEVDGRQVGNVPWEGDVPAGRHVVTVGSDGMKDFETRVDVERGQVTPLRVRLRPAQGRGGAIATTVIGALFLGGGIALGVLSNDTNNELATLRDDGRLASDDQRIDNGRLLSIGANVSFGLAGLLGILSLYYFLEDSLPPSEGRVLEPRDWAFAPRVGGTELGLDLAGVF